MAKKTETQIPAMNVKFIVAPELIQNKKDEQAELAKAIADFENEIKNIQGHAYPQLLLIKEIAETAIEQSIYEQDGSKSNCSLNSIVYNRLLWRLFAKIECLTLNERVYDGEWMTEDDYEHIENPRLTICRFGRQFLILFDHVRKLWDKDNEAYYLALGEELHKEPEGELSDLLSLMDKYERIFSHFAGETVVLSQETIDAFNEIKVKELSQIVKSTQSRYNRIISYKDEETQDLQKKLEKAEEQKKSIEKFLTANKVK